MLGKLIRGILYFVGLIILANVLIVALALLPLLCGG
jgi:hypothetical protein